MKTKQVRIISPMMIGGKIATADSVVEVTHREAHEWIAQGRAVAHGDDAGSEADGDSDDSEPRAQRKGRGRPKGDASGAEG